MQQDPSGVLYVYRCPECGHRGEARRPDDTHDGAAATCAACHGPVTLEWDGGVTFSAIGERVKPTPADLKALRAQARRTQEQVAELLGVNVRQVQRWEAGQGTMPYATWRLLRLTCAFHYPIDFARAPVVTTASIENGDTVELHALDGTCLQGVVWLDRVHDGLVDEESYGAFISGFLSQPTAAQIGLFRIGERVTFARSNVFHLTPRMLRGARS
ncbi:helix-turn-helix domain-containing protein [Burkholderia ubonensis]|uniref:helix-turn-helix domain-containing protein n=1 Tax=Burkholderia ubonensis TaxID=101571 RepID=UPI0009B389FF|nr:helix-turn-helix domain-containing protein [Burkholderia ubonensis]